MIGVTHYAISFIERFRWFFYDNEHTIMPSQTQIQCASPNLNTLIYLTWHLLILDNQSFIAINVRTRVQELKINPERETILNRLLIMVVCYKQTNIVFRRQISSCCIYEFFRLWPEVTDVEALREIRQRVKLMKLIIPLWHSQLCLIVDTKCDFRNWNITFSNLWTILKHVWSQEMWK